MRRCIDLSLPMHLSGIWVPVYTSNPYTTGSLGAGLCLRPRIAIRGCASREPAVTINGVRVNELCPVKRLADEIGPLTISIKAPAPLGAGLGVSAAAAIGYAVAANIIYSGTLLLEDAALQAHAAEVLCRTGLGDVIAEFYGGFEIRVRPGGPGYGLVKHIYLGGDNEIYIAFTGTGLDTPNMLRDTPNTVYIYGEKLLQELIGKPDINSFFRYAEMFTRRIFDYTDIDTLLGSLGESIDGYFVKKNVVAIKPRDPRGGRALRSLLEKRGIKYIVARVDKHGLQI